MRFNLRFFGTFIRPSAIAQLRPGMEKRVRIAAEIIARRAKSNYFKGQRTKAILKGRSVTSPPNILGVLTGNLRKAITVKVEQRSGPTFTIGVGPFDAVVYGAIHEFGGKAGRNRSVNIPARPYLGPAIEDTKGEVFKLVGGAFRVL